MDSYPDDLLTGVFPLVFAADAILPPLNQESNENVQEAKEGEAPAGVETSQAASTRSLFDRFLDAIAASLVEEEPDSPPKSLNRNGSDTFASLLRGDDNSSSDEDDDRSLDSVRRNAFARRASPIPAFRNKKLASSSTSTHGPSSTHTESTAYARALSSERFFQRARILSISTKHGFPPSKDPDGTKNRALLSAQASRPISMAPGAIGTNALRRKSMIATEGILPAGWLEKHVHALPSALIVVTTLSAKSNDDGDNVNSIGQEAQTQHLLDTIQQLKYNLAPKRQCHLHVVCLVDDDPAPPSILRTDAWLTLVKHHTELPPSSISLVSVKDLQVDMMTSSPSLRDLHVTLREASLAYYLAQARRAKYKHSLLGHEHQPLLLPLATRYCFKIAIFYEFQLKHEKSLKFFALAYRHVQTYYQFLLNGSSPAATSLDMMNPQDIQVKSVLPEGDDAGIEVSLADASDEEEEESPAVPPSDSARDGARKGETTVPDDMAHQCRTVADWLNFKLLQAAFTASALGAKEEGLLAASSQWRRHAQVMLRENDYVNNPAWNFWAYVAHQRLVMSQLVERHLPVDVEVSEEVLIRCSPWRNYLAAAEAELMVGAEMKRETSESVTTVSSKHASQSMRLRFVGDLDSEGLMPKMYELSKQDHTDKALKLIFRAIELFEQGLNSEAKELKDVGDGDEKFVASGARMYYITGGILLGMKRHEEATSYLEKAAESCAKWEGLELSIRKMRVACYAHCMPPPPANVSMGENDQKMFGTILRSGLPLSEIRPALESYFKVRGTADLRWNEKCTDESDLATPFSFSVTFPNSTHATAGDTVAALVTIRSNLSFPVHVKSIALSSVAGQIDVPSSDLMNAENAEKGIDGGIILPSMTIVRFIADIALPRDLDNIASDLGTSANTPPVTRPRTAGLTSAAGARLVSEDCYGSFDNDGQWSKSLLGGKPVLCSGMSLMFFPAYNDIPAESCSSHFIKALIQKKKPKSVAPPKRTPFEDNNYVESAWARPNFVPLSEGPRCLRVLGPMPHMIVTNLTDAVVNGKALEGTVNRILFKLEAGAEEWCNEIEYKVTCSTTLVSSDGTTTHLNPEEGVPRSTDSDADLRTAGKRTPVIVSRDKAGSTTMRRTDFGYDLPLGWCLEGTGHATDKVFHHVPNLIAGEATYIFFELYRPPCLLKPLENPGAGERQSPEEIQEGHICQTNFDISITYRQSRQSPDATDGEKDKSQLSDFVKLEHSGSIVWESPLCADFSVDGRSQRSFPSGSRHPSNYLSSSVSDNQGSSELELALINGETTSARCILRSNIVSDGLGVEIARIGFEEKDGTLDKGDTACELQLQTGSQPGPGPGILFASSRTDGSRMLTNGSKFGVTFSVKPSIREQYIKGSVSTRLGVVWVDWCPISIPIPEDIPPSDVGSLDSHGPLRLSDPSTMKFRGPECYIEDAPFETVLESLPPSPRVAVPFEMSYRISNKTGMQQKFSVLMSDQSDRRESGNPSEGVLVSGLVSGDITLSPFESQTLLYTALATKAGKTTMPALSISSERYKTWLVKDKYEGSREIFVLP